MFGTEWIAPTITGVLLLVTSIVAGAIAVRNVRTGAREQRAPSVIDAWAATDRVRDVWYQLVDEFYLVRGIFKGYVRRAQDGGSLELTEEEKAAINMTPPSIEREKE